jgi:hypothetical protein
MREPVLGPLVRVIGADGLPALIEWAPYAVPAPGGGTSARARRRAEVI